MSTHLPSYGHECGGDGQMTAFSAEDMASTGDADLIVTSDCRILCQWC